MRFRFALLAAALVVGGTASAAPQDNSRYEAKLAKALEGRTAGKPVKCINLRDIRSTEIIDRTAVVYRMYNGTVYVNRPSGASTLDNDDILVTKTFTSQLCSIDIVQLVSRTSRFPSGSLGLSEFTPYSKVDTAKK
ncbi:hypothetical protein LK533_07445 [Sphingomonas sp. PL-96]|uniref:hypothetical protein n=1 Tax=Sphingomonas sp. PL-96 TaxID=2887201 RepID=UPI001E35E572|nr:hypothetical protein [Sphingomonas sp. PL-96]MCC2976507.1 hypothetical protein [Sphingomonas sp. PL-96]